MSIIDHSNIQARDVVEMKKSGASLAESLYQTPVTALLYGELGAGKTTFVQGLADGLGIKGRITSPTYALEQRYGKQMSHIDLYRLTSAQAKEFLATQEQFPGIRMIEWGGRTDIADASINIVIEEKGDHRRIDIAFADIQIPTDAVIKKWIKDVYLPDHIVKHMNAVAAMAERVADAVLAQGRVVRKKALHAAAVTHDLLRFVDFKSPIGHEEFTPTLAQVNCWTAMKEKYGAHHEAACEKFLKAHGFPEIGRIVSTHRGYSEKPEEMPKTIEQKILAYADKRVKFDTVVSLDERFEDFKHRYRKGEESAYADAWLKEMKRLEKELLPGAQKL